MADAVTTSSYTLPKYAEPYITSLLGQAAGLVSSPYQAYPGQRVAPFSPLQQQAFQGAAALQPSTQTATGADIASQAANRALGTGYQAYTPASAYTAGPAYQGFSPTGGYDPFQTGQFTASTARQYMSPYTQSVVDIEQREAARRSEQQRVANQAQATTQGAFGGARSAIVEAERQRNLGQQMGDIQTRGLQSAYEQAANRFAQEQQMREQSRQYGAGLGAQLQQMGEQSRQFGAGLGFQERQFGAELGARERQLAEQSRQYGAGLGLQGLQTAMQGAGQLGALGGQQFQQGMDAARLQSQFGAAQQQRVQSVLEQQYQDFLKQQQRPYEQIGFMSNLLRGFPLAGGGTQTTTQAPPSLIQQLGSLGLGAYGLSQLFAEGGEVGPNSAGYYGDDDAADTSSYPSSFGLGGIALNKLVGGQG